jgi:uncharacterized protein YegL
MTGREAMVKDAVERIFRTCQSSPKSENILQMLVVFDDEIDEVFGFKPLPTIDPQAISIPHPRGSTALIDAGFFSVGAIDDYSKQLSGNEIDCNAILWVVTDGAENSSKIRPDALKAKFLDVRRNECVESIQAILIGIGVPQQEQSRLEQFSKDMGYDYYFDLGDFDEAAMARLTGIVSQSLSSTSQSLGTGGPSQIINPVTGLPAASQAASASLTI